ncbi:MAG: VWA domain-containing protein [Thermoflexales bacterium]|nr:VWA domain-containing protein [Thermoflexales bacterium]MDW8351484.1 VWA domain-containing protein [Anaerolineae bacterium]
MLSFGQPIFLILLALLPISALIALPRLVTRRRVAGERLAWRRRLDKSALAALGVRWALLTSLIFALAGAQAVQFTGKLAVVFLIDASDSVGPAGVEQAAQFVREALRHMRADGNDQAAVVVFGADAHIERAMSDLRDLSPISAQVRSGGTNVEGAIRLGMSLLPSDAAKRIVLLSDGKQNIGDAESAARLVRAAGIRLDVVPLPSVQGPDAAVERVDAPQRASAGQIIPLQVVVRANQAMRAQLTVLSGPDVVAQEVVNLTPGLNEFSVRANATRTGFGVFRAQIAPEADVRPQNNALSSAVIIGGPPRVLLVATPPEFSSAGVDEVGALKEALAAAGIEYDVVSPRAMPSEIQSLAGYQAVVLVNVPARELSLRAMYSLQSYVRDIGGGLVVIGGPNSYGVGGYFKTPLEETLPVEMQVKDPKRFPSVSIVVVMDKSGSMSAIENGVTKMRLAAEAAARVAELVNDDDEVTVIGFDTELVDLIGPFQGRDKNKYINQILSIAPGGGGIYVYESLLEAEKIVARSSKLSKFIILLADGNDAERQEGVPELVQRMRDKYNTTLSVVAFGDGTDVPFLKRIAAIGKGRYHFTDKAANLPTIFTEEAALAQRSYIVEQPFFPKLGMASPILSGISEVPALQGYVASVAKPAAQVILRANESDPLLAAWQYGLGRAVAFTSDATGRWAKNWVRWNGFPKFWAQAIRWTILERGSSSIQVNVQQRDERTVIVADVPEAQIAEDLKLTATVIDGDGLTRELALTQIAPGRYEAETYLEQAGAYFVRVAPTVTAVDERRPSDGLAEAVIAYVRPYSPEYAQVEGGEENLRDWALLGGGEALAAPSQAFALNAPVVASRADLFPLLLALAALLLPFDVGVRRIVFGLRRLFGASTEKLMPAGSLESRARVEQLLRAKARVTREPGAQIASRRSAQTPSSSSQAAGTQPPASQQATATASELLRRRRQRAQTEGAAKAADDKAE